MIDKLKQYEVAWARFVEWIIDKGYKTDKYFIYATVDGIDGLNYIISDYELYGLCIEWLDSKRIYLTITSYYDYWIWLILKKEEIDYRIPFEEKLSSRTEATEAGIIKGFEILNNQKEK